MTRKSSLGSQGFTLPELMVVSGMLSLVILAALEVYMNYNNQQISNVGMTSVSQQLLIISEYLVKNIQSAGGSAIQPWHSIWVENNCDARGTLPKCQGSDRITVSIADTTLPLIPQCPVTGVAGNVVSVGNVAGACCLTPAYAGRQITVASQIYWLQKLVRNVDLPACQLTVTPGQADLGNPATPGIFSWAGSTVGVVNVTTYYADLTSHILYQMQNMGAASELTGNIFDLQFALGYDFNPIDGNVTDTGSNADEWLYNAAGESFGAGVFASASYNQLRLVQVGAIVGAPVPASGQNPAPITILDGPARITPRWKLKQFFMTAMPRNIMLYQ